MVDTVASHDGHELHHDGNEPSFHPITHSQLDDYLDLHDTDSLLRFQLRLHGSRCYGALYGIDGPSALPDLSES